MKKHFLLLKEHKITGLKYLCYHNGTRENCFVYRGSGKYWLRHLSKHGRKLSTIILAESDDREGLIEQGLQYSQLWDVVDSDKFANLTVECCQSIAEPLSRPEVRQLRDESFRKRLMECGQTDKEKARAVKACKAMQDPEVRKCAAKSLSDTWADLEKNHNLIESTKATAARRKRGEYTQAELKAYQACSARQIGKTMMRRCGSDYIDPRAGKTAQEIFGDDYVNVFKGKTRKEVCGEDYIDSRAKPFQIVSSLGTYKYECESDCIKQTNMSGPTLTKLKKLGTYTVKRQKNTKHSYPHGETITLNFING